MLWLVVVVMANILLCFCYFQNTINSAISFLFPNFGISHSCGCPEAQVCLKLFLENVDFKQ